MISDRLREIIQHKEAEIEPLRLREPELRRRAVERDVYRGFRRVLDQPGSPTLIAEVKKASPSAGIIAHEFDPVEQALSYARGGAHAISVLTETAFFQGSLEFMEQVRQQVDLPVLRKDFTLHPCQVYESVAHGADAILLIVAALSPDQLKRLYECARTFPVDILVEVHDLEELDRALELGADIIGINNRNLKTFEVDLQTTAALAPEIPSDTLGIAESGLKETADLTFCRQQGIDCFLIGESLMRSHNVELTIQEFLGA